MTAQAHDPIPRRRFSPATLDLLLVLAVPLAIYLVELRAGLVGLVIDAFDAISVFGIQGDELLVVLSSLGFLLLFYSMRRQRETRRSEVALQQSERRFRALIENSADGIVLLDPKGNILYRSPASERMLGRPDHGGLVGNVFEIVHPDDLQAFQAAVTRILSLPGANVSLEYRARHGDGSWRWLEAVATNLLADPSVHAVVANYRDITARKAAEAHSTQQVQRLAALRNIDIAIIGSVDLPMILNVLLQQALSQLQVDAASVLLVDSTLQTLEAAAGLGFRSANPGRFTLRIGDSFAGRAALERRMVHIPDLAAAAIDSGARPSMTNEDFVCYYGMPLIAKGQVKGVLNILHRSELMPDQEWVDFLEALAGQAAIAIDNAELFNDLQRSNADLTLAYDTTLEGWSRALDLRDRETEGHSLRVTETTVKLARALGLSDTQLVQVRRGALLHDIGKMGVPDRILLKPEPLTDDEWFIMRKHPAYAYELLFPIQYLRPALDIPYCHHEKWDGTGYPRGLKAEQIPLTARIFALVDVWDALRSERPYRPSWPVEKVREHILSLSGTHFDPKIVDAFLNLPP